MKYVDEEEKVRMLIAERHPFNGVENYFRDPSSIKILLRLMRIRIQKNLILAMRLI